MIWLASLIKFNALQLIYFLSYHLNSDGDIINEIKQYYICDLHKLMRHANYLITHNNIDNYNHLVKKLYEVYKNLKYEINNIEPFFNKLN